MNDNHDPASGLIDQPARNHITTALGHNLFVEAGAGSGKTSSLVSRIVELVESGIPVARIAAVTFTEAAARELRTRVRDALEARGENGSVIASKQAGEVEAAAFTTVHGFALRILSDHPVEAGLPPGFGVVDEISSLLDFDEAWRVFLGRVGDDLDLLDLQERAAALGIELRNFAGVARRFDDNWDQLDTVVADHDFPALSPISFDDLFDDLDRLAAYQASCISPDDKYAVALADYVANVERVARLDVLDQLQEFARPRAPRANVGKKASWREPDLATVKADVVAFNEKLKARSGVYRDEVMEYSVILVARFVRDRVTARSDSGELSFHDLLVLARRLLRSNEAVRQSLHQRYTRILLDEFQDTDPIQIELAVLLASSSPVEDRLWPELAAEVEPGRLVVVGDPKQSIYRFRRADIGVYNQTEQVLVDRTTRLTTNFRSVPGIVQWVNAVFGDVMGSGDPGVQPLYVALHANREPGPPSGGSVYTDSEAHRPVTVIGGPHDKSVPVRDIRDEEAADVAAVACRIIEESWPVYDSTAQEWRPPRLSDIAVLIPSRLTLPSLEAAFGEANVPFRPETNSLVYATQEVRDVLAAVRATVDPANAIDVVACLRSSLFAVGDDALLDWKLAGGHWDYRHAPPSPECSDHAVAAAFAELDRWHRNRWWVTAAGFIDQVVRERRLRESALAEPRPRDRWRRYRFLAEQARQFTESDGGDLHEFVDWVEVQSSELARVTEPIPPEPDDDAVRVLTVHGSKGLEFPIVILAGAPTGEAAARPGPRVLFPPGERPQVKLGGDRQTASYDLHAAMEDVLDANERIRLHYVAATRARDHLVASAHHKQPGPQDKRTSIGRRTWDTIGSFPELWRPFERRGDERYDAQRPSQLRLAGGGWGDERDAWTHAQTQITNVANRARTRSASEIAASAKPIGPGSANAVAWATDEPRLAREITTPSLTEDDLPTTQRTDTYQAAALGSAVHRVMETVDFDDHRRLGALVASAAVEFGVDGADGSEEIQRRVEQILGSDTMALARRHRCHRELYVATALDQSGSQDASSEAGATLVEGFIDLVIETDDGLLVVDYKTDALGSDPDHHRDVAQRHATGYRLQGATYALALGRVTQKPVVGVRFVFATADAVYEVDLEDLDKAMGDVESLVC